MPSFGLPYPNFHQTESVAVARFIGWPGTCRSEKIIVPIKIHQKSSIRRGAAQLRLLRALLGVLWFWVFSFLVSDEAYWHLNRVVQNTILSMKTRSHTFPLIIYCVIDAYPGKLKFFPSIQKGKKRVSKIAVSELGPKTNFIFFPFLRPLTILPNLLLTL